MVYLRWVGHWTCGILDDCWGIFCSLVEMQVSDLNWKNHSEDLKWNYDSTSLQCFPIYTCSAFWNFLTLNTLQLSSKGEIWDVLFQFILCPMFSTSVIAGSNIIYDWYFKGTQLNNDLCNLLQANYGGPLWLDCVSPWWQWYVRGQWLWLRPGPDEWDGDTASISMDAGSLSGDMWYE